MRHDPASAAVVVMLRGLKMYGMAQGVGDLIEQGAPAFEATVPMLSQLLKAEIAEREVRSISYQIKAARFPAYKDLVGFDFASSEVNEAMVRQLHRGEFMVGADNVVLIGGPGTGKTHIATALGVQAVEHHRKKVRFFSTVDLVNALEQEKTMNKAGQLAERLLRLDLVVLDELGYLPFSPSGGALLFHLLSKLYERTSVVITTNLSFSEWAGVSGDGSCGRRAGQCPWLVAKANHPDSGNFVRPHAGGCASGNQVAGRRGGMLLDEAVGASSSWRATKRASSPAWNCRLMSVTWHTDRGTCPDRVAARS